MYVANYGNNTVSQINTSPDVVIGTVAVGTHPVAMAEMPNGQKLYVVNQGSGTVSSINILGFGVGTTIPVGSAPVWAAARSDSAKIYVLDNSGAIYEIDTLSNTAALVSTSMGTGANYMALDPKIQRLYVTNPTNGKVGIFDVSGTLNQLAIIDLSQGANAPCPSGCSPVSVTGIGDGSRAYVASYQLASCTDSLGNPYACLNTQVEVLNTGNNTISKVIPINTVPVDTTNPTGCGPPTGPPAAVPWTPGTARFRTFVASSGGGSTTNFKVYVSQCDAGSIAVIDTRAVSTGSNPHPADVYTVSLAAPLSSFPPLQASISGADFSSGTTTYTYTPTGLGLQAGMKVLITGMSNSGNNGYFVISSVDATTGTFAVANAGGATATSQNGSGTVLPPQNPVLVVAGP
jgi:YVTN family beta-propeller protein